MKPPKLEFGDSRSPLVLVPKGSFLWNFNFDPQEEMELFGDAVLTTAGIDEDGFPPDAVLHMCKVNMDVYIISEADEPGIAFVLVPPK